MVAAGLSPPAGPPPPQKAPTPTAPAPSHCYSFCTLCKSMAATTRLRFKKHRSGSTVARRPVCRHLAILFLTIPAVTNPFKSRCARETRPPTRLVSLQGNSQSKSVSGTQAKLKAPSPFPSCSSALQVLPHSPVQSGTVWGALSTPSNPPSSTRPSSAHATGEIPGPPQKVRQSKIKIKRDSSLPSVGTPDSIQCSAQPGFCDKKDLSARPPDQV